MQAQAKIIVILFGGVLFFLTYFLCRQEESDIICVQEYHGIITSKYKNPDRHYNRTIVLTNQEEIELDARINKIWDDSSIGDSIYKNKGNLIFYLIRNRKDSLFFKKDTLIYKMSDKECP